jgi:hypothetical protein
MKEYTQDKNLKITKDNDEIVLEITNNSIEINYITMAKALIELDKRVKELENK